MLPPQRPPFQDLAQEVSGCQPQTYMLPVHCRSRQLESIKEQEIAACVKTIAHKRDLQR